MHCSPLGSSVHGISQARILTWVAISFSKRGLLLAVIFFFPPAFIPCFISLFGASKKKQNKQTFLVIVPFCCWYFIPIPSHCGFLHVDGSEHLCSRSRVRKGASCFLRSWRFFFLGRLSWEGWPQEVMCTLGILLVPEWVTSWYFPPQGPQAM